jgi:SAM-dependent methyltransferase
MERGLMKPENCIVRIYTEDEPPKPYGEYLPYDNYIIHRGKLAGHCAICGVDTLFELHETPVLREELDCPNCGTFNRIRQLIIALARVYGIRITDDLSLVGLLKKLPKGTRILLLEEVTPIAAWFDYAARLSGVELIKSEYLGPTMKSGETKDGIMHLDIMDTHFPDDYFDLIIHADVFEHVADAPKGEKEQVRILRPGGYVVYTAPTFAELKTDDIRTVLNKDGSLRKLKKPIYHGDPSPGELGEAGSIVFRLFSYQDIRARYSAMNVDYACYHIYAPQFGIIGQEGYVHVVTKQGLPAKSLRRHFRHVQNSSG